MDSQGCNDDLDHNVENADDGPSDALGDCNTSATAALTIEHMILVYTHRTIAMLAYKEPGP
jgi:hypothetical protein